MYVIPKSKTGIWRVVMQKIIMQIAACWYPVTVFGPGKKFGVWFQGCSKKCADCISPEYQEYGTGNNVEISDLLSFLENIIPDGLVVSGGEPFDQPYALLELVSLFSEKYNDDILIYTGYTLEEIEQKKDPTYRKIIEIAAVIIDGSYDAKQNTGFGLAGSLNQKIHIRRYFEKYKDSNIWERKLMCVQEAETTLWMIGVPPLEA